MRAKWAHYSSLVGAPVISQRAVNVGAQIHLCPQPHRWTPLHMFNWSNWSHTKEQMSNFHAYVHTVNTKYEYVKLDMKRHGLRNVPTHVTKRQWGPTVIQCVRGPIKQEKWTAGTLWSRTLTDYKFDWAFHLRGGNWKSPVGNAISLCWKVSLISPLTANVSK